MKSIQHIQTLFHYDGPQVFEARDAIGGHYVAVMVESENVHDRYLVIEVTPERLCEFRSGKVDLRSVLMNAADQEWYVTTIEDGLDQPLQLVAGVGSVVESGLLPDPGFVLPIMRHPSL